uniref:Vomeronasal type-1 receptor n=1 Tax=Felis catus TaxID=9685 RepID=A0ABI8AC04_FELCA
MRSSVLAVFWWNLWGFLYRVSCHLQIVRVLFLTDVDTFISSYCLFAVARTSRSMLNKSGKNRYPCLIPDLRGKALSFSPLRMILAVGFSYMAFIMLRYVPSKPTLLML